MATLSPQSKTMLEARYLDPSDGGVEGMWDRVSMGNAAWRRLMAELLFLPNSPTLFNLGLPHGGTSSACFVFDVADTLLGDWPDGGLDQPFINSILGTNFKASCVAKAGGGVGYYLGNIRRRGSGIRSTHKKACGPVEVLKYYNQLRSLITQGGKRDLAQMGVLNADHPDIREFIHCKDEDPQALSAFNISVSWKAEMLDRINFDRVHEAVEGSTSSLWWEQCTSAWKTGCPGMFFWDAVNRANPTPHLGDINAPNPCGETPNISDEPCNLGSLAICRFLEGVGKRAKIAWGSLREHVRECIRFMDAILDANKFPHPDITRMALATRKLGLGVMGWADLLALMHTPYDCQGAVDLGEEVMKVINETALQESLRLAADKGPYPAYETAPRHIKDRFPRARNATRTSIAPTGSISVLAEVWGSIEPYYALSCERTTYEGIKLEDGVPRWVQEKLNNFQDHTPKIAKDIDWRWHIRHQAAFQKHTDLGVSKTINLPHTATVKDVSDAYQMMWDTGCKGGTVFRDGCREEQVLVPKKKTSVYTVNQVMEHPDPKLEEAKKKVLDAWRKEGNQNPPARSLLPETGLQYKILELPDEVPTVRKKFKIGGVKGYIHAGVLGDRVVEVFIRSANYGSETSGWVDAWCKMVSKSLQAGVPLAEVVKLGKNARFDPAGFTGDPTIPKCSSIPDFVCRWLEQKYLGGLPGEPRMAPVIQHLKDLREATAATHEPPATGLNCPDCGTALIPDGGCYVCRTAGCGFSKC